MIRNLFSAPKKTVVAVLCALAILIAVGTETAFMVNTIAENTPADAGEVRMFTFVNAGVDPVTAENVYTELDFEQGHFTYDMEFTANETEHDY